MRLAGVLQEMKEKTESFWENRGQMIRKKKKARIGIVWIRHPMIQEYGMCVSAHSCNVLSNAGCKCG